MFDTATGITEGIRDERAAMRERSMDWRQRRLQHKLEALHDELDREREARRALTDAMSGKSRTRGRGLVRVLLIGGGAYILGTRAGRERYDQMTGWIRDVRDRAKTTGKAVQDEAVQTATQVRDVAVDTARSVGEDVKTTAAQVRNDASTGARAAGKETGEAVQRIRRELNQSADV